MKTSLSALVRSLLAAALVLTAVAARPAAEPQPRWADVREAAIRPGVQTIIDGSQCTANFVFTDAYRDAAGRQRFRMFLGIAAHCAGDGGRPTDTNGCQSPSLPLGTEVTVAGTDGRAYRGQLAYSSWLTMQAIGEGDANTCRYNDFALVRLPSSLAGRMNPSVPFWGGPDGMSAGAASFDTVHAYGNSGLRPNVARLRPIEGRVVSRVGSGWAYDVYTMTPGVPGDSGSAYLDADGDALGVLSTLQIAPVAGSNTIVDVGRALHYANRHGRAAGRSMAGVDLAPGTKAFDAG